MSFIRYNASLNADFQTWADGCDDEEVAESSRVDVENIKLIGSNNRDKDLKEKQGNTDNIEILIYITPVYDNFETFSQISNLSAEMTKRFLFMIFFQFLYNYFDR